MYANSENRNDNRYYIHTTYSVERMAHQIIQRSIYDVPNAKQARPLWSLRPIHLVCGSVDATIERAI